jgi:hypothetical protein
MSLFDDLGGAGVYVLLLVLTFAAHALLVGFVLGAAAWTTVRALRGGEDPVAAASRDWLPFALGAAITAGVAPLLMVQVLYQHRMYTATLLLSHRFMAIVPALIVGFYLLYLAKTARVAAWPRLRRAAVTGVALALFIFVAWTWVEEHTLAQAAPETWVAQYREQRLVYADVAIAQRLLVWLGLAMAAFAVGAAWLAGDATDRDRKRLALVGIGGLVVAAAGAAIIGVTHDNYIPRVGADWIVVGGLAFVATAGGFQLLYRGHDRARAVLTAGIAILFVAVSALREARRVHTIVWRPTLDGAQGLPLFLVFFVGGALAIVWCARLVSRNLR